MKQNNNNILERPAWIRGKITWDESFDDCRKLLKELDLNSVCIEAACPNTGECWKKRHVTFMLLGKVCTRGCYFCNVPEGELLPPDLQEPVRIAEAVKELGIKYSVITSVTRDDLQDQGAGQFISAVEAIKEVSPEVLVEFLIPDLNGDHELLEKIAFSGTSVVGHNIEMPENLYSGIRPRSDYCKSLDVLKFLGRFKQNAQISTKSAIVLGLGETDDDILRTLEDLRKAEVDIAYIGQYLSPTKDHSPVKKYYTPEEFQAVKEQAESMGFKAVMSDPMVRSSYRASEAYLACQLSGESI